MLHVRIVANLEKIRKIRNNKEIRKIASLESRARLTPIKNR